jgi:hypothetical protein
VGLPLALGELARDDKRISCENERSFVAIGNIHAAALTPANKKRRPHICYLKTTMPTTCDSTIIRTCIEATFAPVTATPYVLRAFGSRQRNQSVVLLRLQTNQQPENIVGCENNVLGRRRGQHHALDGVGRIERDAVIAAPLEAVLESQQNFG